MDLAQGAVSTFYVRRMHHHGQKLLQWRRWLKWVVVVDLNQKFVLRSSRAVVRGTIARICLLSPERLASKHALDWCWPTPNSTARGITPIFGGRLGAQSVIPDKRGMTTWRTHGVRAEVRRHFLGRRPAVVETGRHLCLRLEF